MLQPPAILFTSTVPKTLSLPVEHAFRFPPSPDAPFASREEADKLVHKLGNLALITPHDNKVVSNKVCAAATATSTPTCTYARACFRGGGGSVVYVCCACVKHMW